MLVVKGPDPKGNEVVMSQIVVPRSYGGSRASYDLWMNGSRTARL